MLHALRHALTRVGALRSNAAWGAGFARSFSGGCRETRSAELTSRNPLQAYRLRHCNILLACAEEAADANNQRHYPPRLVDQSILDVADLFFVGIINVLRIYDPSRCVCGGRCLCGRCSPSALDALSKDHISLKPVAMFMHACCVGSSLRRRCARPNKPIMKQRLMDHPLSTNDF
jgi:hypothetical protein